MSQNTNNSFVLNALHVAKPIVSLESDKIFLDARNLMLKYNIKRVVISSPVDKKVIGIVTEKDISRFFSMHGFDKRKLGEITLEELLQNKTELYVVNKNFSLGICAKLMLDKNISSLLLVDEEDKVNKIITKTDLIALVASHDLGSVAVREYMTQKVITVRPQDNVNIIPELLTRYNISRVIVIRENKPVGIITTRDTMPKGSYFGVLNYSNKDGPKEFENGFSSSKTRVPFAVEDIMTPNPILIDQEGSIRDAAKMMIGNQISGIPVVNNLQELVGIITKTDIIKAIVDLGKNKDQ
ncbi:inosine-5-monophosphate dehydrogenase [Candidatus Nitrosocosmicus sp.]|nr:inosine-5-monophosphate dehydrogenase [Candidatus Nitrosocosmicus sp.]